MKDADVVREKTTNIMINEFRRTELLMCIPSIGYMLSLQQTTGGGSTVVINCDVVIIFQQTSKLLFVSVITNT